jgi:lariat debranching enzyme
MRDLYFGGWLAPKIYYLGQAGSIYLTKGTQKIRITGISGIYNDHDFKYGIKTENIPLTGSSLISNYHVKQIEIFRMELLARIAIMKI